MHRIRFQFALFFLLIGLVLASASPSQDEPAKEEGFIQRFLNKIRKEESIPMPECLITLSGGVDEVEKILLDDLQNSKSWSILVTATGDQSSRDSVRSYYEAVRQLCGEPPIEGLTLDPNAEPEVPIPVQEQNPFDSEPSETYEFDPSMLEKMKFAHMSFETEANLMWRWWIWKVPSILFIEPTTSNERLYDIRFWKIAFKVPNHDKLIAAFKDELWKQLPVWESTFAPGGENDNIARYFSIGSGGFMSIFEKIPNWLLGILASMFGSFLLTFLHRGSSGGEVQGQAAISSGPAGTKKMQ